MHQHVHRADAQHGAVEVVAVESAFVETFAALGILVNRLAVVIGQILGGGDQEARSATGRVTNGVHRRGGHHIDHQLNDVAGGAELAVLAGGGDLAQHVFVKVALGVAVGHVDAVELIDYGG